MAGGYPVTGSFHPPPPKGAALTPPISGPSYPGLPSPGGFSGCSRQPEGGGLPQRPKGSSCSTLRPLGRHSPTSDFPSGHCGNAQPSLSVFSLWVGAWELETLFTSSPHPLWRTKLTRAEAREKAGMRKAPSSLTRTPVGKKSHTMGLRGAWEPLPNLSLFPLPPL